MEPKTNYTLVGLAVISLTVLLITVCLWLFSGFDKKKYDPYLVYMSEAVSGLSPQSPVKFNGVKVGYISRIELNPNNPQQVKLTLNIAQGVPITNSTRATLIAQGITGTNSLGLSATTPSLQALGKKAGEPYPVIPYEPSFISQLETNIKDVSNSIRQVFDKDNARLIKASLTNLKQITNVIAQNDASINQSLRSLPEVIAKMKHSVDNFDVMANNLAFSGKQISDTMQLGRITINKLSEQTIPAMVLLLRRANEIANNLEVVSVEMRQNPSVILRGTAPAKLGPGETH